VQCFPLKQEEFARTCLVFLLQLVSTGGESTEAHGWGKQLITLINSMGSVMATTTNVLMAKLYFGSCFIWFCVLLSSM